MLFVLFLHYPLCQLFPHILINALRLICLSSIIRFRFLYYPEFIIPGEAMIIREQRTRGMGTVTKLIS